MLAGDQQQPLGGEVRMLLGLLLSSQHLRGDLGWALRLGDRFLRVSWYVDKPGS